MRCRPEVDRTLHPQRDPLSDRPHDVGWRKHDESGCDELDRQRQSVERPAADLVDRRERVRWSLTPQRRKLDEERGGVLDREWSRAHCSVERRNGVRSWRESEDPAPDEELRNVDGSCVRCSKLSRYNSSPVPLSRSAIAASIDSPPDSRTPIAWAIALGTRSGSVIGARPRDARVAVPRHRCNLECKAALARTARAGDLTSRASFASRRSTWRARRLSRRVCDGAPSGSPPKRLQRREVSRRSVRRAGRAGLQPERPSVDDAARPERTTRSGSSPTMSRTARVQLSALRARRHRSVMR